MDEDNRALRYEDERQGSVLTGLIGALLGACIGALPWYAGIAFTDTYYGIFGVLVTIASAFGYKLFRGRKNTPIACTMIILCSALAVCAACFLAVFTELCKDEDFMLSAYYYGESVEQYVWECLIYPSNIKLILKNSLPGFGVAALGFVGVVSRVRKYTESQNEELSDLSIANYAGTASDQSSDRRADLPRSFVVTSPKSIVQLSRYFGLAMIAFPIIVMVRDTGAIRFATTACIIGIVGIVLFRSSFARITVDGSTVCIRNILGNKRTVDLSEINTIRISGKQQVIRIILSSGKVLCAFTKSYVNGTLFYDYLVNSGVEIENDSLR